MKHLVDHLNHLLSTGNIHQQSSKQGKMMMWFWAQQEFGSRHNYFTKMKKFFLCQRSEAMGSWIPLRELKSDSCHRQFLAHCSQCKVVCWFRGVTPKSPYKSSREGVSQEPLHFSDGKFSTLLYSEGVRHWLFSWPAPPGFPAGSLLPMIPAGTVLPD